jgi:integrase/recombinase XerD
MRISRAIDSYIGELARLGRTQATRTKYRQVLEPFADQLDLDAQVADATKDHCRHYLDRWVDSSPATIALYVSILTVFFAYCVDEGWIDQSPMEKIRRPPLKRPEDLDVVTVSGDEVGRMFAAAQALDEFICVALLAYLGPRRSAAAQLRWRDLDLAKATVKFREKGGKVIVKPIPQELCEMLYQIALGGQVPNAPDDYVIPNREGRAHGVRFATNRNDKRNNKVVYNTVKRVAARAGVDAHPHALRAAFACHYLEGQPGDLDALQKLMGHSRVETTQVYLRRQDRFKAMERVRPLSWASVLQPSSGVPPAGFEPALEETNAADPIRLKLEQLRAEQQERLTERERGRRR